MNLQTLTDDEILQWARMAQDDLAKAAENAHESEWHESCFAACVTLSNEMSRRGISMNTMH